MEFKEKLKQLRTEKGISQQTLADAIHISRSAVAKWENGLGYPSIDSLELLIAYFGVSESYFNTEEPEVSRFVSISLTPFSKFGARHYAPTICCLALQQNLQIF